MLDLHSSSQLLKTLSDPTRIRLLHLLQAEELTVAELSEITRLAQPRVSTHLARLKEIDMVRDRKEGVSSYYRLRRDHMNPELKKIWATLRANTKDALIEEDKQRLPTILNNRAGQRKWADRVAGDMERHYSPGRSWESTARMLVNLVELGDVLDLASGDGVLAELLAPHCRSITCVDYSPEVVKACQKRLAHLSNVKVMQGNMHQLELTEQQFDVVFLNHALTYSDNPPAVVKECSRLLKPGGKLVLQTLNQHDHSKAVAPYDHVNLGFQASELTEMAVNAGLNTLFCDISSRETRPPHFEIISLIACKVEA